MNHRQLVAVVEDEPDIAELVAYHLEKAGFDVRRFSEGGSFLLELKSRLPDLVLLDLMLPGIDGLELCRRLRSEPRTQAVPIIMLTARSSETDRVVGLELGADDYIVKPFSVRELVARVRAVLRRFAARLKNSELIRTGSLVIDPNLVQVTDGGRPVDLTATEFRILELLAGNPGRVFSRDQVIDYVWGYDKPVIDRTVDVHVANLRTKLGAAGERLRSVRGMGYKYAAEEAEPV